MLKHNNGPVLHVLSSSGTHVSILQSISSHACQHLRAKRYTHFSISILGCIPAPCSLFPCWLSSASPHLRHHHLYSREGEFDPVGLPNLCHCRNFHLSQEPYHL